MAERPPWRRLGFRIASAFLLLVATLAVLAPLIASDEPYLLVGVDRAAYASAHRTLRPIAATLVEAAEAPERDGEPDVRRVSSEARAARLRVATLERYVVPRLRRPCAPYRAALDALERAVREGDAAACAAATRELEAAAARVETELDPERVEHEVGFVAAVSSPLLARLSTGEVGLVVTWLALVLALLGARWSARRRLATVAIGALLGLAAGAGWSALHAERPYLATPGTKRALTEGAVDARLAVFPPLAMGYAETHLAETLRPPTWLASSRMTPEGRYETPRGDREGPVAGHELPATPVDVRRAEPGLNHPLRHPFGTDVAGRDLLVRVLWGGRTSLAVGLLSAVLLTLVGTAIGALAGTLGGRTDFALSRAIEVVIAFPAYFLVLVVMALADPDVVPPVAGLVAVIAITSWTGVARLVRAELLRLREADFVLAARALGFSTPRVVLGHMLPNALGPVVVAFAFAFAGGIFVESTVSFLGFGVDRPTPSWGALIAESSSPRTWWLQVFPGLAILLTVLSVHAVGEGLRAAYGRGDLSGHVREPARSLAALEPSEDRARTRASDAAEVLS